MLTSLGILASLGFAGARAFAISNVLPDPADFTNPAVYMEVARPGGGSLYAPQSTAVIYSTVQNPTIYVDNYQHCLDTSTGAAIDSSREPSPSAAGDTVFTLYQGGDPAPGVGISSFANQVIDGSNAAQAAACSAQTKVLTPTLTQKGPPGSGLEGYWIASLRAVMPAGTTGTNAFKVRVSSGLVSFTNQDGYYFAIGKRPPAPAGETTDYHLKFAVPCTAGTTVNDQLIWFDDDVGVANQVAGLRFDLWQRPRGTAGDGGWTQVPGSNYTGPWTGNSDPGDPPKAVSYAFRKDTEYDWRWYNVDARNGMQFQLPFNSAYASVTCAQQWSVTGRSTVNGAANITALPGAVVTFRHSLAVAGNPTDQKVNWDLEGDGTGAIAPGNLASGSGVGAHQVNANNYTIPMTARDGDRFCQRVDFNPVDDSGTGAGSSQNACVTVDIPPPTISCNGVTVTPATIDPTTAYTINASVKVAPPSVTPFVNADDNFYVHVTGPGVDYENDHVTPVTASDGNILSVSVSPGATNNTGTFTVSYGLTGTYPKDCPAALTFNAGYHPYFRIDSGDLSAGAGFGVGAACVSNSTASITGSLAPGTFVGAGAQLGALALGSLSGFPTSTNDGGGGSGVNNAAHTGLTFANMPVTLAGSFGSLPCADDYAAKAIANGTTPMGGGGTIDLSSPSLVSDTTYYISSNPGTTHITQTGALLANKKHITIVVDGGTVVIDKNILYAPYTTVSDAAQFKLLVTGTGNIKIVNNVQELHGVYVAQGGTISTCTNGAGIDTVEYATCNFSLTFYGAVAAKSLLLERTRGSVVADPAHGTSVTPSERFVYSPELWGASVPQSSPNGPTQLDSITSLPPVL